MIMKKIFTTLLLLSFCVLPAIAVKVNEPGPPVKMPNPPAETAAKTKENPSDTNPAASNPAAASNVNTDTAAVSSSTGSSDNSVKSQLDSLAMSILKAAEKHDNKTSQQYFRKMVELGMNSYYQPQIVSKKTPQCPPIKMEINGRNLSGSVCAKMGYVYEEKTYWVGYCK